MDVEIHAIILTILLPKHDSKTNYLREKTGLIFFQLYIIMWLNYLNPSSRIMDIRGIDTIVEDWDTMVDGQKGPRKRMLR